MTRIEGLKLPVDVKLQIKECENTLRDIEQVRNILDKNKHLYNKDINKYLKQKKVNEVFKLYRLTKFKYDNTIEELLNNKDKKALYIQINNDLYIYIDLNFRIFYLLHRSGFEKKINIEHICMVDGEDIPFITVNDNINEEIQEYMGTHMMGDNINV